MPAFLFCSSTWSRVNSTQLGSMPPSLSWSSVAQQESRPVGLGCTEGAAGVRVRRARLEEWASSLLTAESRAQGHFVGAAPRVRGLASFPSPDHRGRVS